MAIAESISYPTSPITPPAATDDVDAGTETRPRRSTVQGLRRKDLYSLFPDSDGLFNLAVKTQVRLVARTQCEALFTKCTQSKTT